MQESEVREATGYSPKLSFDEAFADALAKLRGEPKHPDELIRCRVVETGAEVGGIAGLRRMFVTVRTD
jgi:hypothetical protein